MSGGQWTTTEKYARSEAERTREAEREQFQLTMANIKKERAEASAREATETRWAVWSVGGVIMGAVAACWIAIGVLEYYDIPQHKEEIRALRSSVSELERANAGLRVTAADYRSALDATHMRCSLPSEVLP